jgi:thymidylate synthase (FAD)
MKKFDVKDKRFPKWDKVELEHKYVNMLSAIEVTLLHSTTLEQLRSYTPNWLLSTWDSSPYVTSMWEEGSVEGLDTKTVDRLIYRGFQRKFLPSFLETVRFTFLIEGLSAHDFTHILRNRAFNGIASSDCTGDRVNSYRNILVPEYLHDMGEEYVERYKKATTELMQLYADSMNTHAVSHLDARLMLPRLSSQFIHVSMSLGELLGFVSQRIDRQIQPTSDNIIAMKLLLEVAKEFPFITTVVNPNGKNQFYINESQSNFGSHYFIPNEYNNVFEYDANHFLFNQKRDELMGQTQFQELWDILMNEFQAQQVIAFRHFPHLYDKEYLENYK